MIRVFGTMRLSLEAASIPFQSAPFVKGHLGIYWGEKQQLFRKLKRENSPTCTFGEEYIANSGGKHRFSLNVSHFIETSRLVGGGSGIRTGGPFPGRNHRFLARNSQLFFEALISEKVKTNCAQQLRPGEVPASFNVVQTRCVHKYSMKVWRFGDTFFSDLATRVQVGLGRASVNTVEILNGLQVGDQVILSGMSAWDNYDQVELK